MEVEAKVLQGQEEEVSPPVGAWVAERKGWVRTRELEAEDLSTASNQRIEVIVWGCRGPFLHVRRCSRCPSDALWCSTPSDPGGR